MSAADRAALKSLGDALAECMANLGQIREGEAVTSAMFGEYADETGGGFYWLLELQSVRSIGTRVGKVELRRASRQDLIAAENMRVVVKGYTDAVAYYAQKKEPGEL